MWYFASDLHVDHSEASALATQRLAGQLSNASRHDVLILCGDYGNTDQAVSKCLAVFAAFPGRKFALPGNHDIWIVDDDDERSSYERYQDVRDLCVEHGFTWLDGQAVDVDGIGLVGAMGWYDESFRDPSIDIAERFYEDKCDPYSGRVVWNDAIYARWGMTDAAVSDWQLGLLAQALDRVRGLKRVVVATHHLPTQKLLIHPRALVPRQWRFLNAFLGSERLGQLIQRHPNVELVVSGHVHLRRAERLGRTAYVTVGSDHHEHDIISWDGVSVRRTTYSVK